MERDKTEQDGQGRGQAVKKSNFGIISCDIYIHTLTHINKLNKFKTRETFFIQTLDRLTNVHSDS